MNQNTLEALERAVAAAPDNAQLRLALGEALLAMGRGDDAEKQLKQGLSLSPRDMLLKAALARAFEQQGKSSAAIVLLEELCKQAAPAGARVLYARLLLRAGDESRAGHQYRQAIEADPSVADVELARELGIEASPGEPQDEVDEAGRIRVGGEDLPAEMDLQMERPDVAFANVGGLEAVKDEIRMKIIHPLSHPDLYKAYGKKVGGGILMYGPPGCGKTYLARATAGEIKAAFMPIGINDVLDMWMGNSEKNLHALFEQARRNAPCVLFFDEVDALAARRTDMRTSSGRHLINQFLAELDGVKSSNDGVLILAATNAPWHVDPAFRRPGRFDRVLFVPPPDAPARAAIVRAMLRDKPVDNVDHDAVAKKTDGFSGADLKAVVDITVENKLREAMRAGVPTPITTRDLLAGASAVRPTTREWFSTARNYALYANEGGAYDDIQKYLKM